MGTQLCRWLYVNYHGLHFLSLCTKTDQLNIVNPILHTLAASFVRWSVLGTYLELFSVKPLYRTCGICLSLLCGLQSLIVIVVSCLQCRPLSAVWNPANHGVCINNGHFNFFDSVFDLVLYSMIFIFPFPILKKLNAKARKILIPSLRFLPNIR